MYCSWIQNWPDDVTIIAEPARCSARERNQTIGLISFLNAFLKYLGHKCKFNADFLPLIGIKGHILRLIFGHKYISISWVNSSLSMKLNWSLFNWYFLAEWRSKTYVFIWLWYTGVDSIQFGFTCNTFYDKALMDSIDGQKNNILTGKNGGKFKNALTDLSFHFIR